MVSKQFEHDVAMNRIARSELMDILKHGNVEIHNDLRAAGSGNICLEFEELARDGSGNYVPSCVGSTTADYWAIKCFGIWIVVPVNLLREIVREHILTQRGILITGDNGNRSVLFPASRLFRRASQGNRVPEQDRMF